MFCCRFHGLLITLSSETRGSLVRRSAMRAALIALTEAMALRSHGTALAGDRVAGQTQLCSMPIPAATHSTRAAAQQLGQTGRRHGAGHADSHPAADFGAGNGGVHLVQRADGACRHKVADVDIRADGLDEVIVVASTAGTMPQAPLVGAVSRRRRFLR